MSAEPELMLAVQDWRHTAGRRRLRPAMPEWKATAQRRYRVLTVGELRSSARQARVRPAPKKQRLLARRWQPLRRRAERRRRRSWRRVRSKRAEACRRGWPREMRQAHWIVETGAAAAEATLARQRCDSAKQGRRRVADLSLNSAPDRWLRICRPNHCCFRARRNLWEQRSGRGKRQFPSLTVRAAL